MLHVFSSHCTIYFNVEPLIFPITLILQWRKLGHREVKQTNDQKPTQGQTIGQKQNSNSGLSFCQDALNPLHCLIGKHAVKLYLKLS